jgi:hypothetical protein
MEKTRLRRIWVMQRRRPHRTTCLRIYLLPKLISVHRLCKTGVANYKLLAIWNTVTLTITAPYIFCQSPVAMHREIITNTCAACSRIDILTSRFKEMTLTENMIFSLGRILLRALVTTDGVRLGNSIYWSLTIRNYNLAEQACLSLHESVSVLSLVFTVRFLATDLSQCQRNFKYHFNYSIYAVLNSNTNSSWCSLIPFFLSPSTADSLNSDLRLFL